MWPEAEAMALEAGRALLRQTYCGYRPQLVQWTFRTCPATVASVRIWPRGACVLARQVTSCEDLTRLAREVRQLGGWL